MRDNIDLDVSGVLDDSETLEGAAARLFDEVLAVCSGQDDRRRAARAPRVRDPPPQPDHLRGSCPVFDQRAGASISVPGFARAGRFRWVVCGLLFAATTINYIDRQVLGILAPDLQQEIGWSELDYGRIVIAFQAVVRGDDAVLGTDPRQDRARSWVWRSRSPGGRWRRWGRRSRAAR